MRIEIGSVLAMTSRKLQTLINTYEYLCNIFRVINEPTLNHVAAFPIILEFMKDYPKVNIDLMIDDRKADLLKEGVDVALRSGPVFGDTLVTRKLCNVPRILVASPLYIKEFGAPSSIEELSLH